MMALRRNVWQEDDILRELYVDTHSDVSDDSDSECFDSDSYAPTSSRKQLRSCLLVTSDSEISTIEEESSEP
jgi:hypothetical protein